MTTPDFNTLLIERSLLEALSRMLSHDINGKVMGVEGILSCWESLGVEPENLKEDVSIVRDSFSSLKTEFLMFGWFFQADPKHVQAISFGYFNDVAGRFLSRFFQPPSSFQLQTAAEGRSIYSTPYQLIFWTSSFCQVLGRYRPPGELVELQIDTRCEGTELELRCRSEFLSELLDDTRKHPPGHLPPWENWLALFQAAGGTYRVDPGILLPITLTLPLSNPTPTP